MIANVEKTNCLLLLGDVTIRLYNEMFENVTLQKYWGPIVRSDLRWTNLINYKKNKARGAFFFLKLNFPLSTPSDVKYNVCLSTVLSIIRFGLQVWHADMQLPRLLENFQKFCFQWIFGCRFPVPKK